MGTAFGTIGGVRQLTQINPRSPFTSIEAQNRAVPTAAIIDGAKARDPDNTGAVDVLRAGLIMGKVTANAKYANSIIGLSTAALGGAQTTLKATAQAVTELVRRIGANGTFTLTGAPAAGGVVRQRTVTYSAASGTSITITALATGAVSPVNQINNLVVVDNTGVGTFTITIEGITTGTITYSATAATLVSRINTALDAAFGTSAVVASGASLGAIILTFSGTGYSARPVGTVSTTILVNAGGTTFTINGVGTVGAVTPAPVGTAGVTAVAADEGEFTSGSLIMPTDGSQAPLCILAGPFAQYGVDVNDLAGANLDQTLPQFYTCGDYYSSMIVNLTGVGSGIEAWLKGQLRAQGGVFTFDDDR